MAYNTEKLFTDAINIMTNDEAIIFMEEVIVELGITKETFYNHFPNNSDKLDELKDCLQKNKIKIKRKLRKKWEDSNSAALMICAYKLSSNENERRLLADRTEIDPIKPLSETNAISIEELKKIKKKLEDDE